MVTRTAGTTAELDTAFNASSGGDIIELDAGVTFGPSQYVVPTGSDYSGSPVIVRSADSGNPAIFNDFNVNASSKGNITFEDVSFQAASGAAQDFVVVFCRGANVTFSGCRFIGWVDGSGFPNARGLHTQTAVNCVIDSCKFYDLQDGHYSQQDTSLTFTNNECYGMGSDFIQLAATIGADIDDNHGHDWIQPATGHIDCIQLLAFNLKGCEDINYRRNVMDQCNGKYQQGFWMGGDGRDLGNPAQHHLRILIENNIFITGHINGFGFVGCTDLTVRKNTHIAGPSGVRDSEPKWKFQACGGTITIEDNIHPGYLLNKGPSNVGATDSNCYECLPSQFGTDVVLLKEGAADGYHDLEIADAFATSGGVDAGSRMTKRVNGWSGTGGVTPPATYAALPAGFVSGGASSKKSFTSGSSVFFLGGSAMVI